MRIIKVDNHIIQSNVKSKHEHQFTHLAKGVVQGHADERLAVARLHRHHPLRAVLAKDANAAGLLHAHLLETTSSALDGFVGLLVRHPFEALTAALAEARVVGVLRGGVVPKVIQRLLARRQGGEAILGPGVAEDGGRRRLAALHGLARLSDGHHLWDLGDFGRHLVV